MKKILIKKVLLFIIAVIVGMTLYQFYAAYKNNTAQSGDERSHVVTYMPPFSFSQSTDHENFVKPSDSVLKEVLTPIQYDITQHEGTERPFHNTYWDNHADGIYVDVVSGEPLFSSTDKFDSGTGWPSFLKPIENDVVTEHDDYKLIVKRTEIRSRYGDNHIGHIILDGPESNDFIRYCMNSAALRFVPKEKLVDEGYERFAHLFSS